MCKLKRQGLNTCMVTHAKHLWRGQSNCMWVQTRLLAYGMLIPGDSESYLSSLVQTKQRILGMTCWILWHYLGWWWEHLVLAWNKMFYVGKVTLHHDLCWCMVGTNPSVQKGHHAANLTHAANWTNGLFGTLHPCKYVTMQEIWPM